MSSEVWEAYEFACIAFVEAKNNRAKNPKAYEEAKLALTETRAAYRAMRDRIEGTVVSPAAIRARTAVNNGNG